MSVTISRQGGGNNNNNNQTCSSQTKNNKFPISQFYCNICFCLLLNSQNINRASFVTSCGHFYCEQCAQASKTNSFSEILFNFLIKTFQGLMPTCKICQCSSTNLTWMDL